MINQAYCDAHSIDFICSHERRVPDKSPHWERIPLLLSLWDAGYSVLLWIDADAHFYLPSDSPASTHPPPSQSLDIIIKRLMDAEDKWFLWSGDIDIPDQINTGLFLVKVCPESRACLEHWLTAPAPHAMLQKPSFGNGKWNDQGHLRFMYSENILGLRDHSIVMPYGELQTFDHASRNAAPLVYHAAGKNTQRRISDFTAYAADWIQPQFQQWIHRNIQLDNSVIRDILVECRQRDTPPKMLVFGLGYDSKLWYHATGGNTYFVEHNPTYIALNTPDIPESHIIHYPYRNSTVQKSMALLSKNAIHTLDKQYPIPPELLSLRTFDIILIDGPEGHHDTKCPGRLLPFYWSHKYLSNQQTVFYIDDVTRPLEKYCVNTFFMPFQKLYFPNRLGSMKITAAM